MAMIYKCDRCGRVIDANSTAHIEIYGIAINNKKGDLCLACNQLLQIDFMNPKEEE